MPAPRVRDAAVEVEAAPGDVGPPRERRRGPLRPERLLSARTRRERRLSAHSFRIVDLVAVAVLTWVVIERVGRESVFASTVAQVVPAAVAALVTARVLRSGGLYRFPRSRSVPAHVTAVAAAVLAGGATSVLVAALVPGDRWSTADTALWTAIAAPVLCGLHALWGVLVHRWRAAGWLTPNLVIVGATAHAERLIADALARRDVNVLGVFDDRVDRSPDSVAGVPVLGGVDALLTSRLVPFVDLIVLAVHPSATARVRELAARLATLPNPVTLVVDDDDEAGRASALAHLADAPLAALGGADDQDRRAWAKRAQDLAIGLVALVLAAPVLGVIALAVKLDSPGPVFFRQRRHGFNNEEILVWKFRTMRHETSDARAERQVTAGDDRITRVGRILRTTSLDEVPQLFNVIRGEMSLVGPRPHAVGMKTGELESAQLVAEYAHRHRIKPGMTGWAAIHGSRGPLHSPEDVRRRVALDLDYIDRQSFWLDVTIMARTVPGMLGDRSTIR